MKKQQIFFVALSLLTSASSVSTAKISLINKGNYLNLINNLQQYIYHKDLENWYTFKDEKENFCAISSIQAVIYYLTKYIISQDEIATIAQWDDGVTLDRIIPSLNYFLSLHPSGITFNSQVIPHNFANSNSAQANTEDMQLFQNLVVANFENNSPTMISMAGELNWQANPGTFHHTFVITGTTVVDQDPSNTIYHVSESDLNSEDNQYFRGSELSRMFMGDSGMVFSQNNFFDFNNRQINLTLPNPTYINEFFNADQSGDIHQGVNLTKEVGILNLTDLKKYKTIDLKDFDLKTIYSGKEYEYKDDTWSTYYISKHKRDWAPDNSKSWTYDDGTSFSTRYKSDNWHDEKNNNFYLDLAYEFTTKNLKQKSFNLLLTEAEWIFNFNE